MEALEHNIESEKLFVELLGYTLEGPDANNKWTILDELGNPVGYIKRMNLHQYMVIVQ